MRSQLFIAGALTLGLGTLLAGFGYLQPNTYVNTTGCTTASGPGCGQVVTVSQQPLLWSAPFLVGGGIMMGVSFILKERQASLQPPEGHRFCRFCSRPVRIGASRCSYCNGLQPKE